ncbi:unnamed protein product, partial [Prorocentrum cordatum]
ARGADTAAWLHEEISEAGHMWLQRHCWRRTAQGRPASDAGVVDHHFISDCRQELTTHDQPRAGGGVVAAIQCRRCQLLEVRHAASLRKDEADQDAMAWLDERPSLGGHYRSRRSTQIRPARASWVAESRRGESAIPYGRWKVREERLLERCADPGAASGLSAAGAQAQARGRGRVRRQGRWVLEGVAALNELGGGGRAAGCGGRLSLAQRSALRHLAEVYASFPPKTEVCANQEVFQALLGLRPGHADEPAIGAKAGYQRRKVSLPSRGAGKVDFVRLLPLHPQSALESGHGLLRSAQEALAALDEADVTCFLLELFEAGIVEVLDYESERKEETGIFFAPRNDDKLRLIFDTRRANCHFKAPEHTHLASGDALSSLECARGEEVHLAAGDVEVCFYQHLLPGWARCWGTKALRGLSTFSVRVVPMGWNWAVHLVQAAHLNVLASVSPDNQWLVDKQPGVFLSDSTDAAEVLYIDNLAGISTSRSTARQVVKDMLDTFTTEGVRATLDLDDAHLGFTLDSKAARWRPASKKFWRAHGCIQYLLEARRCITGRQLERLVGHVVALLLLRREALSMLSSVYVYIRTTYDKAQPLWPSCQQELRWVLALLPTVFADMKRPWHAEVGTFDASPWGAGVCTARWSLSAVQATSRQPEKLRFRGPLASLVAPRDAALAADAIELSDPAALLLGRAAGLAEVNAELLRESNWVTA